MKRLTTTVALVTCLSATSLFATADTDSDATQKAYIAGFLAGAQLSDSEIIRRFDDASRNEQPSSFFERAFKTRVGERSSSVPATYYAGFCLPDDIVDEEVIKTIMDEVRQTDTDSAEGKASVVFKAIQTKFPC